MGDPSISLTTETVESPLRREAHGGFGERSRETEQEQSRHRAPGLLSDSSERVAHLLNSIRFRRRLVFARPNIWRLSILIRLTCPSTRSAAPTQGQAGGDRVLVAAEPSNE